MASSLQQSTQAAPSSGDGLAAGEVPKVSWKDLQYPPGSIGHRKPKPKHIDRKKQMQYLCEILSSKVYDVAVETPMQLAPILSTTMGNNLWLKREDTQQIFSFKIRGAYNMVSRLTQDELKNGVICSSVGNHSQGVALAAQRLHVPAVVIMPLTTPQIKIDAVKRLGGEVELFGDGMTDATARAKQRAIDEGLTFIAPDHHFIISGQGSIGVEISRQMRDKIHAIFVPIGSGGLASGLASYYKLVFPEVLVFGVQPNDSNAMAQALCRGEIVNVTDIGDFAEGVALAQVSEETYRICIEVLDDVILVDKHAISRAIKGMFNDEGSILETSGALSIAAAQAYCEYNNIKGQNVVAVTSGANINFDELGHIADYANADQSIVVTKLPDRPGSFQELIELLGENIFGITYRFNPGCLHSIVVYKIKAVGSKLEDLLTMLNDSGFKTSNLSNNKTVIDHLFYMAGGRANVENEKLYHLTFPEKEGSLKHFLSGFHQEWNITLFHHRQQGVSTSDVLVGIQLDNSEEEKFLLYLKEVGYTYEKVTLDDSARSIISQ